jgi:hypothetical protein
MQPMIVAKNQFAAKVWKDDAHVARQVGYDTRNLEYAC